MSTLEPEFLPPTLQPHPSHRLAVFIDIENFAGYCADMGVPVDIDPVLDHLSKYHGRVQIKRSFGDVSSLPAPAFNPYRIRRMLQAHQVDHLDIPHRPTSYSKNSADIRLVVEAVALIHQRPEITHIVVVSNDRDFIPLFNHAREHGKVVIGCGPRRSNVNEDYRHACDMFLFHEDWVSPRPTETPAPKTEPAAAAVLAPDPQLVSMDASPAPSVPLTQSPALPGASSGYFAPKAAPEQPENQRGTSPEGSTTASAPDKDPTECLLATLRSLQVEGGTMVASRVALRLKVLFPGLDVKQVFGSFKQFCIEQAKSGRIVLHNLTQPNFTIAIQE
ncbi:MAG: NYN domain-containing protein, partial [Hydrogenophaga sp.]|nr:NYN domain-containing protein [Hydrogenophaga sp.]